jgi:Lrp/AsnC family leucine-responsive transcriptional regulator
VSCFHLAGDYDYLLKIQLEDMAAYRHFLVSKLTAIPHIGSTQSAFVISEVKDSTHIPL